MYTFHKSAMLQNCLEGLKHRDVHGDHHNDGMMTDHRNIKSKLKKSKHTVLISTSCRQPVHLSSVMWPYFFYNNCCIPPLMNNIFWLYGSCGQITSQLLKFINIFDKCVFWTSHLSFTFCFETPNRKCRFVSRRTWRIKLHIARFSSSIHTSSVFRKVWMCFAAPVMRRTAGESQTPERRLRSGKWRNMLNQCGDTTHAITGD